MSPHVCHLHGGHWLPTSSLTVSLPPCLHLLLGLRVKKNTLQWLSLCSEADKEIVCRSLKQTQIGQTAVRQNKRIISCWYLREVDFQDVSRGLQCVWSVVHCVSQLSSVAIFPTLLLQRIPSQSAESFFEKLVPFFFFFLTSNRSNVFWSTSVIYLLLSYIY